MTTLEAAYESLRTPSGWQTRGISPPASLLSHSEWTTDGTPDLSRTVWIARTAPQSADALDLYLRDPDGSFHLVGPMVPPSDQLNPPYPSADGNYFTEVQYRGASADLSHLFFSSHQTESLSLWPGDETFPPGSEARSLYEYTGTANSEPELVGVANNGTVAQAAAEQHKAHINEAAQLISRCGIALGSGAGRDSYNAISTDGETVFFTAFHEDNRGDECFAPEPEVNELYARLDRSQTVDLSEPTTGPTGDCEECQTASREPAVFQGASADGSKAFFFTEQELLPGAAGKNLYAYDFTAPAHHKLALLSAGPEEAGLRGVARVSQDGSHVYFVARGVLAGANAEGNEPQAGANNLYVRDTEAESTTFIAALSPSDSRDWAQFDERPVAATPDGRYLVFPSAAQLTPDDTSTVSQLFEYDATTGELVRISVGQRAPGGYFCPAVGHNLPGYNCDGNTADPAQSPFFGGAGQFSNEENLASAADQINLTPDGSTVTFVTTDPLTPASSSPGGCYSTYEYRSEPGGLAAGNVFQLGPPCASGGQIDPSGRDVLLETDKALLPTDGNTDFNLYDARTGGGFPAAAPPPFCQAEACQGPSPPAPSQPGSATSIFTGPPNQAARHKPNKHHKKLHPKKHHKRSQKRAAAHNRGGQK